MTDPEDGQWREKTFAAMALKVTHYLVRHGGPERNVFLDPKVLDRDGDWGKAEAWLGGRVGGMLVALIGANGTGKTQLAVELMRGLYLGACKKQIVPPPMLYSTVTRFFARLKDASDFKAGVLREEVLDQYGAPSLLVLDEAGKRGESAWEENVLFEMISGRYDARKDTLLLSNQSRDGFLASIGPSLASRLCDAGGIIECNWPSFRNLPAPVCPPGS